MNRFGPLRFAFPSLCFDVPGAGAAGGAAAAGAAAAAPAAAGAPAAGAPAVEGGKGLLGIAAAAPAAVPPAAATQPGTVPGTTPGAAPYYPEGLRDAFKGASDRETIDALAKGLRHAPDKPDAYKLELTGELAKRYGGANAIENDPVLPIVKSIAHKAGLDNAQFQTMFTELHSEMQAAGLMEPPIDVIKEMDKLAPNTVDPVRKRAEAATRIQGATGFLNDLANAGHLTKGEANILTAVASVAEGVQAIEKLRKMMGEHGVQLGGQGGNAQRGLDAIKADMRDERYDSRSSKFDKAFQQRVIAEHTAFFKGK
jgi:hypothetical protein